MTPPADLPESGRPKSLKFTAELTNILMKKFFPGSSSSESIVITPSFASSTSGRFQGWILSIQTMKEEVGVTDVPLNQSGVGRLSMMFC